MTRLVWFRNDLRITDHPALAEASVGEAAGSSPTDRLLSVSIFPERYFIP